MDLLLTNNPQFLFHKYAKLVTWFANTQLGRDYLGIKEKNIVELLPNSHRAFLDRSAEKFYLKSTFYPCDFYNKKLGAALSALDIVSDWIKSFKDGQEALAFYLGLRTPTILLPKIYMATLTADALSTGGNELGNVSTVSYATAHDAASGSEVNVVNQIANQFADPNYVVRRMVERWDTSSLTSSATITAASVSIYVTATSDGNTTSVDVVSSTATDGTIVAGDFSKLGTTSFGNKTLASLTLNARNSWTLDATGQGQISKIANTLLGVRMAGDRTNTSPGVNIDNMTYQGMEDANKPQLIVTYTLPTSVKNLALLGVG